MAKILLLLMAAVAIWAARAVWKVWTCEMPDVGDIDPGKRPKRLDEL